MRAALSDFFNYNAHCGDRQAPTGRPAAVFSDFFCTCRRRAIIIIRQRLKLMCSGSLDIRPKPECGTAVTIRVPDKQYAAEK